MDINDCNYSIDLVESLRIASEELLSVPIGNDVVDSLLLNRNTAVINAEIKKYRDARNSLAVTKLEQNETLSKIPTSYTSTDSIVDISKVIQNQYPSEQRQIQLRLFEIEYPNIDRRIKLSDITSAEVLQIIELNGLNPNALSTQVQNNPLSILDLTETYLANLGNGIDLIGSCFVVNNVYSTIVNRKDPFNNAGNFINDFTNFINSIGAKFSSVLDILQKLLDIIETAQNLISNIRQSAQTAAAALGSIFESDFGLVEALQLISIISNLASFIRSVKDINNSGTCPVSKLNIDTILNQLTDLSNLTGQLNTKIYDDYTNISNTFDNLAIQLFAEAENVSVTNPSRTKEISDAIRLALSGNISSAFSTLGQASKDLGLALETNLDGMKELTRAFAAIGVLSNLDQQLSYVVDTASSKLKSKLYFFTSDILDNNFSFNMGPVYAKNAGLIASAQKAASNETAEQMKGVIRGQIAIAGEKYRDPKKEEVDFMVLRFSNLVNEIERLFDQSADPLETIHTQFRETDRILSAAGNKTTLKAIGSGATRFDTQARLQASRNSGIIPATASRDGIANLPQGTAPYDGYGPMPNLPSDYQFPSYEEALTGKGGIKYSPGPASRLSGRAGFTPISIGGGVDTDSMRMLYLLASRWGSEIKVISAYRNPKANDRAKGKRGSWHLGGKAFDCEIIGRSNQIRFMNLAYQIGFRGFGSYDTFTHIDTRGSNGDWGNFEYYNLSGPAGAKGE